MELTTTARSLGIQTTTVIQQDTATYDLNDSMAKPTWDNILATVRSRAWHPHIDVSIKPNLSFFLATVSGSQTG